MILTEYELRANWHKTKEKIITIPEGTVITPAARDYLRQKGIEVKIEGNGSLDLNKTNYSTSNQTRVDVETTSDRRSHLNRQEPVYYPPARSQGGIDPSPGYSRKGTAQAVIQAPAVASATEELPMVTVKPTQGKKQEFETHLRGSKLVDKKHPVIAFRGQLDSFDCLLIEAQIIASERGEGQLVEELEEIGLFARKMMLAEVRQEPLVFDKLIGLTADEIRDRSHHPDKYYGVRHKPLDYRYGLIYAKLQQLRAKAREVELAAARSFVDEGGHCQREDIIQALNRFSSLFYILACQLMARQDTCQEMRVPIGISNRHLHLSQQDLEALFGAGASLSVMKDLSQPGQFAANETVDLIGPKGSIEKVRILGPVRKQTQVEVSGTDCRKLGIKAVVRDSGQLSGAEEIRIRGPKGEIDVKEAAIVASRHLHLSTAQAEQWCLKDGQKVSIKVDGERPVTFEDVTVRVNPNYEMDFHIDLDEANAVLGGNAVSGLIVRS